MTRHKSRVARRSRHRARRGTRKQSGGMFNMSGLLHKLTGGLLGTKPADPNDPVTDTTTDPGAPVPVATAPPGPQLGGRKTRHRRRRSPRRHRK